MTLKEFNKQAIEIASEYGISEFSVTTIAGIYGSHNDRSTWYIVKGWDSKRLIHIESHLQRNPESALENFKDELYKHFKSYDQTTRDIELT